MPKIVWHPTWPGQIEQVFCHCGNLIRALVPDERYQAIEKRGTQTIIRERLFLASMPEYEEVEVEMSDGSSHVFAGCKTCIDNANVQTFRSWYAKDILEMREENRRARVVVDMRRFELRTIPDRSKITRPNGR